MPRVIRLWF